MDLATALAAALSPNELSAISNLDYSSIDAVTFMSNPAVEHALSVLRQHTDLIVASDQVTARLAILPGGANCPATDSAVASAFPGIEAFKRNLGNRTCADVGYSVCAAGILLAAMIELVDAISPGATMKGAVDTAIDDAACCADSSLCCADQGFMCTDPTCGCPSGTTPKAFLTPASCNVYEQCTPAPVAASISCCP
jgi:hypothetical protein